MYLCRTDTTLVSILNTAPILQVVNFNFTYKNLLKKGNEKSEDVPPSCVLSWRSAVVEVGKGCLKVSPKVIFAKHSIALKNSQGFQPKTVGEIKKVTLEITFALLKCGCGKEDP